MKEEGLGTLSLFTKVSIRTGPRRDTTDGTFIVLGLGLSPLKQLDTLSSFSTQWFDTFPVPPSFWIFL